MLEPATCERRPELWQRVPDEDQLQQRRRRAEKPAVEDDHAADGTVAASSPEREQEPDDARGGERRNRELEGEKRSLPVWAGSERFPEDVGVEGREHPRRSPTSRHPPESAVSLRAS